MSVLDCQKFSFVLPKTLKVVILPIFFICLAQKHGIKDKKKNPN